MGNIEIIQTIGIMIVVAAAVILTLRRLNIPSIVLFILTGLVLGPILGVLVFHGPAEIDHLDTTQENAIVADESEQPVEEQEPTPDTDRESEPADRHDVSETIHLIAEVGIVLLLFLVGLELSFERIRDVGKVAVAAGIGQVVFTALFGFLLALMLQFTVMESIFIATALTFSSTVVVVKLLDQKKELHALYGRIAVGIFLVQDLVVIIVLTFLAGLGAQETMSIADVAAGMGWAFGGMGLLLGFAIFASKYLIARPFEWAARSSETLFAWSLCWCFLFVVASQWMGLSMEIGAFLAGVSLAQLKCSHELRRRVHPLMNFFIAIFFISLGAQMELSDAAEHWFSGTVLSLFVLIGNPFIFMWIISKMGYGEKTSFLTSVTVAQISEFSFIFAAVGLSAGLISQSILSLITVVGLITIAASSYMILYNRGLYEWCRLFGLLKMFGAKDIDDEDIEPPMEEHIIIVGMNSLGRVLARRLHEKGETVLAIDVDPAKLSGLPCRTMLGNIDYPSVIEEAHMDRAKLVISALHIEDTNNLLAYRCKHLGVPTAIHAFDHSVIDELKELNVSYLIDSRAIGGVQTAIALSESGVIERA